jgi:hypothetical protein
LLLGPLGPALVLTDSHSLLTVGHGLLTVFRVQKRTSKYGNVRFFK